MLLRWCLLAQRPATIYAKVADLPQLVNYTDICPLYGRLRKLYFKRNAGITR
jgi:hypothetical protein